MPSDIGIVLDKVKETILAKYCVDSGEPGGGALCFSVNLNKLQTTCPFPIILGPTTLTETLKVRDSKSTLFSVRSLKGTGDLLRNTLLNLCSFSPKRMFVVHFYVCKKCSVSDHCQNASALANDG